jgi:hypothetical protein
LVAVSVDGGRAAQASDVLVPWDGGVTAVASTSCVGCVGNCRCFAVDVGRAPVLGLRAVEWIQVRPIADAVGNPSATQDAGIGVTRYRWERPLPGFATRLPPVAVSRNGVVVAGVDETPATNLRLYAFAQDGGMLWAALDAGTITAGPIIGANTVWVGVFDGAQSSLLPITLSTGALRAADVACISTTATFKGDLALSVVDGGGGAEVEIPLGVRNGAIFPGSSLCVPLPLSPSPTDPADSIPHLAVQTPLSQSTEVFVVYEGDTVLWKAQFANNSWLSRGSASLPAFTQPRGLFLDGTGRVGGGGGVVLNGAVFATSAIGDLSGGSVFVNAPAANAGAPVLGAGYALWGALGGVMARANYKPDGGPFEDGGVVTVGPVNLQTASPVLGRDSAAYFIGSNGQLLIRSATDLSERWSASLGTSVAAVSQPALDVFRDAAGNKDCNRPVGVLYVVTRSSATATLRAILVDSNGLDPNAPWPKYQRDNANTGNGSLSTLPWACP